MFCCLFCLWFQITGYGFKNCIWSFMCGHNWKQCGGGGGCGCGGDRERGGGEEAGSEQDRGECERDDENSTLDSGGRCPVRCVCRCAADLCGDHGNGGGSNDDD